VRAVCVQPGDPVAVAVQMNVLRCREITPSRWGGGGGSGEEGCWGREMCRAKCGARSMAVSAQSRPGNVPPVRASATVKFSARFARPVHCACARQRALEWVLFARVMRMVAPVPRARRHCLRVRLRAGGRNRCGAVRSPNGAVPGYEQPRCAIGKTNCREVGSGKRVLHGENEPARYNPWRTGVRRRMVQCGRYAVLCARFTPPRAAASQHHEAERQRPRLRREI